jgi:hypothetical protein
MRKFTLFLTILLLSITLIFLNCRKTDSGFSNQDKQTQDYSQLKKQFFNASAADPEVQKVANDIKKQDSIFKFLPNFVKKNGIPKWDKVLYQVKKGETTTASSNGRGSSTARTFTEDGSQGIFLIPLQSTTSPDIQSYITAYKHNDSLYTYRLYNKDSLSTIHPDSIQAKTNLLNTEAVFGYFEKTINGKDSISVTAPANGQLKNVKIGFDTTVQSGRHGNTRESVLVCDIVMTLTVEYEWRDFVYGGGDWYAVSATLEINLTCTGDGGGGGCECSSFDPQGAGNYWWMYGTGWPWYTTGGGYNFYLDPNAPWYPWWTSGGASSFSPTVDYLTNTLGLSWDQSYWLSQNPDRANEILYYLQTTSATNANQTAVGHIYKMMIDIEYLSFVQSHAQSSSNGTMWWEDNLFLVPYGGISFGDWAINYIIANPQVTFGTFQNQFMTIPEGQDGSSDQAFWDDPNNTYSHQNLPSWSAFEAAFPKRSDPNYDTPQKLYTAIGGAVYTNGYTGPTSNTCAARVSRALNYSGVTIPNIPGKTYQGSDGKYYFLGAENLNRWMRKTFGCANPNTAIGEYSNSNSVHYNASQIGTNGENLPTLLSGMQGIYTMVSNNASWATGHADLLNPGSTPTCDGGCHFDGPVRYIDVWKLQ